MVYRAAVLYAQHFMTNKTTKNCSETLNHVIPGSSAIVSRIVPKDRVLARKLLTMGIVAGTSVRVLCVAPLGDPIQIRALDYTLSLRKCEAEQIEVVNVRN